jgi:hypothetical protein
MNNILAALKHRGLQVIAVLVAYCLLAPLLPTQVHQGLYTISIFIKDLLMWMLPLTVGLFIAHTVSSFQKRAPLFIFALILFEALSNFSSVWYAYLCGHIAADSLPSVLTTNANMADFTPLWRLPFLKPAWWSADKGSIMGLVLGCVAAFGKQPRLLQGIEKGKQAAQWILTRIFSRLIPLFILGFVARMVQMKLFQQMLAQYGVLLIGLLVFLAIYIGFLFLIGNGGSFPKAVRAAKNLLPAGGIAFTSGCSISTMPWTIAGTSKNLKNPEFAQAVIPATTNIQQIGDCIANTFLCFLIYRHFYGHNPDLLTWLHFTTIFVLARFATAAVIGGAIFIMLPIYETYLSFNAEMIAIILAFNVILDPIITSSNVIANGSLCPIFEKAWSNTLRAFKLSPKAP